MELFYCYLWFNKYKSRKSSLFSWILDKYKNKHIWNYIYKLTYVKLYIQISINEIMCTNKYIWNYIYKYIVIFPFITNPPLPRLHLAANEVLGCLVMATELHISLPFFLILMSEQKRERGWMALASFPLETLILYPHTASLGWGYLWRPNFVACVNKN